MFTMTVMLPKWPMFAMIVVLPKWPMFISVRGHGMWRIHYIIISVALTSVLKIFWNLAGHRKSVSKYRGCKKSCFGRGNQYTCCPGEVSQSVGC